MGAASGCCSGSKKKGLNVKSLAEQIGCRCVHFSGIQNRQCEAGIVYATVKGQRNSKIAFPCFRENEVVACEKRRFPTTEEVEAEVASTRRSMDRLRLGIEAVAADAKKHGLGKGKGGAGSVPCPVCNTGTLNYSVAGYNGHMHGRCTTAGCLVVGGVVGGGVGGACASTAASNGRR